MASEPANILIIQTAFIGDVILATALIESLSESIPGVRIDFLVRKGNESLLANNPHLGNVLIWDKKQSKYKHLWALIKTIKKNRYDVVVNLQRFAATGLMTMLSGAELKLGFKENPFAFCYSAAVSHDTKSGIHEVERNQVFIREWAGEKASRPRLYPAQSDYQKISRYLENPYVCIAPTSVWFTKQFPPEKWLELILTIPGELTIYLLGGPDDYRACERIKSEAKHKKVINLSGELSFLQSAALMESAQMNFVNDSAPMHIASSMNAPTTAVYCSTIPQFGFGPLSDRSVVVESNKNLTCRPCGLHGKKACPKGDFECATSISLRWK